MYDKCKCLVTTVTCYFHVPSAISDIGYPVGYHLVPLCSLFSFQSSKRVAVRIYVASRSRYLIQFFIAFSDEQPKGTGTGEGEQAPEVPDSAEEEVVIGTVVEAGP